MQNQQLAGLLDPFGFQAFGLVTRYWTPAEQNSRLLPLWSLFGANRLIWISVALGLLSLCVARFRTTVEEFGGAREAPQRSSGDFPLPTLTASPSRWAWLRASVGLGRLAFAEIIRSPLYWAFAVAGVAFVGIILAVSKELFGTPTLPVTWLVLESASQGFRLFVLITITFYAGELVWRERDTGVADIVDATRAPTWVSFFGKLLALALLALSLEVLVALCALGAQVFRGYFAIEWRLYLEELLLRDYSNVLILCVLAFVVQVALNHKYLGHAVMVGYFVTAAALRGLGVEEPLLRFASEPTTRYSDMNGYGHSLGPLLWFRAYWWGLSLVLLALAYALWPRGREARLKARAQEGRRRLGPGWRVAIGAGLLLFAVAGGVIFDNTHLKNRYVTAKMTEREQAEYEKTYKPWQARPQPRITAADFNADLFPEERRLHTWGTYALTNETAEPIADVFLNLDETIRVKTLRIGEASAVKEENRRLGVVILHLDSPLAPGEVRPLVYDLERAVVGFSHGGDSTDVVGNGSFFNNSVLPVVGYQPGAELVEDGDRKDYGLAPKERMAPRDDATELQHNYIRRDSDFVTFTATVSTTGDQLAIAPGYLEKDWREGSRHYFRYVMDQPILNFFSVLSARYAVKRDEWNGVKLEIYYHPTHTTNLDRMMQGMKDALAYCSENFGPYQHRQARIVEFPRYQTFAQSFPNTIPYSEAIGFIARVRDDDPDDVDYPYYVTAHEIAHQWWAHQVVGANVRGATMTSESMAQYSALMVMKKKFGPERMRRFLKFELDRYLLGRALERKKELPLAQNENQPYIHYEKGSLALYALQDFIGEATVNRAMKKYVSAVKFKGPPYTTSLELESYLKAEMAPEQYYLLEDLFETITLYDNRATSASMKQNASGGWDVKLKVLTRKFRSDDKGNQTDLDFAEPLDVGALDEKGAGLCVEKRKVTRGESELGFSCPTRPAKVGIDPLNELIDKDPDDNTVVPTVD